jgi:DNA polymerase-1
VCEYAGEDADITWRLAEALRSSRSSSSPTRNLFAETEMPLVEVLAEMEHNGVALDVELLATMSDELAERLMALAGRCTAAGHEFNIESPKQLVWCSSTSRASGDQEDQAPPEARIRKP